MRTGGAPAVVAGAALLLFAACGGLARAPSPAGAPDLRGTAWRLVRFQGGDGTILTPDDPSRYTIAFGSDGQLSVRIDCNRGRGTWTSPEPGRLELGPLALTRATCPPGSLHDRVVRHWAFVRSWVVRDGHLFLSLMAGGGIYECEPLAGSSGRAARAAGRMPPRGMARTAPARRAAAGPRPGMPPRGAAAAGARRPGGRA
jgi:heat shock protein HslJ